MCSPRWALWGALALALVATARPAAAVQFSLADLVAGGSFQSDNGELGFSMFDAELEVSGVPGFVESFLEGLVLSHSQVISLDDGFKIWTPLVSVLGFDVKLHVDYKVAASEGFKIDGAKISFLGFELEGCGDALSKAVSKFFEPGTENLVAMLMAEGENDFVMDAIGFDPTPALDGRDWLIADTEGFALAKSLKLIHQFRTVAMPAPEPGTGLLLLTGLGGLAFAGRRRRPRTSDPVQPRLRLHT